MWDTMVVVLPLFMMICLWIIFGTQQSSKAGKKSSAAKENGGKAPSPLKENGGKAPSPFGGKTYTSQWGDATIRVTPSMRSCDARGWRAKIGFVVPATNTIVQPDFEDIAQAINKKVSGSTRRGGITNHCARIMCQNSTLKTEEDFEKFQKVMRAELPLAVDRCLPAYCDRIVLGISAPSFYFGYQTCVGVHEELEKRAGMGISSGSFSCEAALRCFKAERIAFMSPYGHFANGEVTRFFTEAGFTVVRNKALFAPNPIGIAEITAKMIKDAFQDIDSPDVDVLIQVGTNCSGAELVPELEEIHKKPVIAINTAAYWHALRALGINDKVEGFGRLMEEF